MLLCLSAPARLFFLAWNPAFPSKGLFLVSFFPGVEVSPIFFPSFFICFMTLWSISNVFQNSLPLCFYTIIFVFIWSNFFELNLTDVFLPLFTGVIQKIWLVDAEVDRRPVGGIEGSVPGRHPRAPPKGGLAEHPSVLPDAEVEESTPEQEADQNQGGCQQILSHVHTSQVETHSTHKKNSFFKETFLYTVMTTQPTTKLKFCQEYFLYILLNWDKFLFKKQKEAPGFRYLLQNHTCYFFQMAFAPFQKYFATNKRRKRYKMYWKTKKINATSPTVMSCPTLFISWTKFCTAILQESFTWFPSIYWISVIFT